LKDATAKTLEGVTELNKNHSIETSADLTALEKGWLDRKTNHQDLMKAKAGEAATLERQDATEVVSLLWLEPSYLEYEATSQEVVKNFHLCTQYQKHHANDAEELERYGLFKKSKARMTKLNALNPESVFGITSMSDKHVKSQKTLHDERCKR